MTAVTLYDTTVRCDEPGCKHRFRLPITSVRRTRKKAAAEGWSQTGWPDYRDLCPDHTRTGETDE